MSRTLIDVDDELLSQAGRVLGTRTKKDTVNRALRRVVAVDAGLEELRLFGDGRLGDATILQNIDALGWRPEARIDRARGTTRRPRP